MPPRTPKPPPLRDAFRSVQDRVARAALKAGSAPDQIVAVAVTKYASPDQIRLLVELGQRDFGENRVQQLTQRVAQLQEFLARRRLLGHAVGGPEDSDDPPTRAERRSGADPGAEGGVRWHLVGHLQRNKVRQVVPLVRLIHSVDTLRLAEELHAFGARADRAIDILLQVNASGEPTKFGIAPPAVPHVAQQVDSMVHLRLRGLMTIAPYSDDPEDSRPAFARTAELFHELRAEKVGGHGFNILSMGMSGDFEVAIAEGANLLRLGRAFFGEPPEGAPDEDDLLREPPSDEDLPSIDSERIERENRAAREE